MILYLILSGIALICYMCFGIWVIWEENEFIKDTGQCSEIYML